MNGSTTLRLAGAALAAWALAVASVTQGFAQAADSSTKTVKAKPTSVSPAARKPAKPTQREVSRGATEKPWTLENALPDNSKITRPYEPPQPKLGRMPLQSGTVGLETETKTNAYKTPDGRTIPGLEASEYKSNSYMGLSLSVPTSDKPTNLIPLDQLWGRP